MNMIHQLEVSTARILIVDDEPANLKLLDKMLAGQGYERRVLVQDSREVLARYREERPDLILLDINMPHLDGYQVMAQIMALNDPL
ncbi:MAG: response regulator, partial [Gammaproteobacteria bacterium]|nr:response regulator [Gammaproteobacteria bacterium]